jgi:hypothetical protein
MKTIKNIGIAAVLLFSLVSTQSCGPGSRVSVGVQYANPPWAPAYYPGVRYYYLPDIEAYYDLSDGDFVYLDNGQWLFSPMLPPMYGSYDLYTGFVIALDAGVFQPWLHHHYYISHYPRYYYKNYYQGNNLATIRGFNENAKKPFYWQQGDRDRANDLRRNEKPQNRPGTVNPRQPQPPHYYGKNIGQPVKVKPQMRENRSRGNTGNNPPRNTGRRKM